MPEEPRAFYTNGNTPMPPSRQMPLPRSCGSRQSARRTWTRACANSARIPQYHRVLAGA